MTKMEDMNNEELYALLVKVFNNDYDRLENFIAKLYQVDLLSSDTFIKESVVLTTLLSEQCNCEVSFAHNVKTGMKIVLDKDGIVETFMLDDETLPTCLIKYQKEIGDYIVKYNEILNSDIYKDV